MTAIQFRSDKDLVAKLRGLLENEVMVLAREVLATDPGENPVLNVTADDVTPHYAHIQLGQQTGYAQYPQRLKALATHLPSPQDANPDTEYAEEPTEPQE